MKSKDEIKSLLSRLDFVNLKTTLGGSLNCIILEMNKDAVIFLPTDPYFEADPNNDFYPKVELAYERIEDFSLNNKSDLIFLVDKKDPAIQKTLKEYFNERENCWEI